MINNKIENNIFIYDRLKHKKYEINYLMFKLIKKIHLNNISYEEAKVEYDLEAIKFLFDNNILIEKEETYISNIKELSKTNNARIFMELTNKCNLNCKHCYGGFANKNNDFISIDKVLSIIKQAEKIGVYEFDLTGGEPLLYSDLETLLDALYNAGMLVTIFTNLVLLTNDKIKLLKKYGVKKIITSIDSCKEHIHDEFRGRKGSFKNSVENIKKLKKLGFEVAINTMIGKHNIKYIDEHISFLKSLKIPFVLDVIIPEGRAVDLNEDIIESSKIIKKIVTDYKNDLNEEMNFKCCGIADRFIYIKSDGKIYICPSLIKEEFYLGNIYDNVFIKDIWKNMQKKYNYICCSEKQNICKNCSGGCRARVYNCGKNICDADEVYCNIIKEITNV